MRIFLTIAVSFLWLNSFSQEKTIVVKKQTPELTINGNIKNKTKIKRSTLTELLKLQVINCDCPVISFEIFLPLDGRIVVMNYMGEYIPEEAANLLISAPPGSHLTITSVKVKKGEEIIPITPFSAEIID